MDLRCEFQNIVDKCYTFEEVKANAISMKATFRAGIILLNCVYVLNQSVHNLSSLTAWRVLGRSQIHPGPDKYPGS